METTRISLLGQQLSRVQASMGSKNDFILSLQTLKKIVSDLIENPSDDTYKVIRKDGSDFLPQLLYTQEFKELLEVLGYIEEADYFVFYASDENIPKLEHCLHTLDCQIKQQEESVLQEINGNKRTFSYQGSPNISNRSKSKSLRMTTGLKELFLSKHLQKEQSDGMVGIRGDKRNASRSSDFSFNTNGYFHQSCNNKDTRKNKCFIKDLFHHQDHDSKGWSSSSFNVKLI